MSQAPPTLALIAWALLGGRPAPVPPELRSAESPAGSCRERPSAPAGAVDGTGAVLLVWESRGAGEADIRFSRRAPGAEAAWLPEPLRLDTDVPGAARSLEPRIAAGPPGAVYAAWQDARSGADDIRFNRSTDGGRSWQAEDLRLDDGAPGGATSSMPSLAADRAGRVYVAWEDLRDGDRDIFFARSTDGGRSFGANVRLDTDDAGSGVSYHPQVVCRDDGTVLVGWWDERGGLPDIYMRRSTDAGASWGGPEARLDPGEPGAVASRHLRFADAGGRIVAAWEESGSVLVRVSTDGGAGWGPPVVAAADPAAGVDALRDPVPLPVGSRLFVAAVPEAAGGSGPPVGWWVREVRGGRLLPGPGGTTGGARWIGGTAAGIWSATWSREAGLRLQARSADGRGIGPVLGIASGSAGDPLSGLTGLILPDGGAFLAWIRDGAEGPSLEALRADWPAAGD